MTTEAASSLLSDLAREDLSERRASSSSTSSNQVWETQKKLFPIIPLNEFSNQEETIREIHEEFRRDGYIYVECNEELLQCLEQLARIAAIFFNLPVAQKKAFRSLDVIEKIKKNKQLKLQLQQQQQQRKEQLEEQGCQQKKENVIANPAPARPHPPPHMRNVYMDGTELGNDEEFGFTSSVEIVSLMNCSGRTRRKNSNSGRSWRLWTSFLDLFRLPHSTHSNPGATPTIAARNDGMIQALTADANQPSIASQSSSISANSTPAANNCNDLQAKLQVINVNRAQGKGYVNNESNPREFYDISENDQFIHLPFTQISQNTYQIFQKYSILMFQLLMYSIRVENQEYMNALITGKSHSKLRLIRYNFIGDDDKETCLRHTDMGFLTLAPALSSGLEMKSFLPPYHFIDVEAESPKKPCLIFFAGEAMGRLTGGYFQAPIHRVTSNFQRFSFPFFFRPNTTVVLDMKQLKSPILEELMESDEIEVLLSITANDLEILTQKQYKTKQIPLELGRYKHHVYYQQLYE